MATKRSMYYVPVMVSIKDKKQPDIVTKERQVFAVISYDVAGAHLEAAKFGEVLSVPETLGPYLLNATWQI